MVLSSSFCVFLVFLDEIFPSTCSCSSFVVLRLVVPFFSLVVELLYTSVYIVG